MISGEGQDENIQELDDSVVSAEHTSRTLVPLAFLGLGLYRAWIEIVFVGSFVPFQVATLSVRDVFDWSMVAVSLLCVLLARKISPFYNKRSVFIGAATLTTVATVLMFLTCWMPEPPEVWYGVLASVLGGSGIALIILIWSELYGCLNPVRVALYYSGSIVVGALVIYVYMGFLPPWVFAMSALLPACSLLCARRGFGELAAEDKPSLTWLSFKVPWKAMVFMAAYALGYGLMETHMYVDLFGPHSTPGTLLMGVLVFVFVLVRGDKFNFGIIYRVALPLIVVALFLVPAFGHVPRSVAGWCMAAAYTGQSILIMLVMSSICYRYGVSAIWLFGLERAVRQIAMWLGRMLATWAEGTQVLGASGEMIVSLLALAAVFAAALLLFSERDLTSRWGADFIEGGVGAAVTMRKQALTDRCAEVARTYKLSSREEEVLVLLAKRKTVGIIQRELVIANGTAKAHVRHVYRKLGIHTRQELFDLLGVDSEETLREL
ncbi:helix-turn-helix transcriptional regulator [Eggerthellaceae bacterium 3-80]|nr:LuxR family transcriptional regulator [bacterium D16-34]